MTFRRERYARGLFRLDRWWTRCEIALAMGVITLEVGALAAWVVLRALSTPVDSDSSAGWLIRAALAALGLGGLGWAALAKFPSSRPFGSLLGIAAGALTAHLWLGAFVDYSSNLVNWLQQASTLTLFGGLRGVATRLTIVLWLLGASLATARGKHITIDLLTRALQGRWRAPVLIIGWIVSAAVLVVAAWGFFDHMALESFHAEPSASALEKLGIVSRRLEEHWFVLTRQIELDLRSFVPIVLEGRAYAEWLPGDVWNQWVESSGFVERYGRQALSAVLIPPDQTRAPMIVIPEMGEPRGELMGAANLALPLGLLLLAIRFVLRSLRTALEGDAADPLEDRPEASPTAAPKGAGEA